MKKVFTFENVEVILGKEVRAKIAELSVRRDEIHALHRAEDGNHILAVKIHHPKEEEDIIPRCLAFLITKEDYDEAVPIFKSLGNK